MGAWVVQGRYWPAFQTGPFSKIPDMVVGPKGWFSGQITYDNEAELTNTKQVIFGAFPHGVVSFHHVLMASDSAGFISKFPHLSCHQRRDLAASICFKIPRTSPSQSDPLTPAIVSLPWTLTLTLGFALFPPSVARAAAMAGRGGRGSGYSLQRAEEWLEPVHTAWW